MAPPGPLKQESLSGVRPLPVPPVVLTREARAACEAVAAEYVATGELEPPGPEVDWLVNGAGASRQHSYRVRC